MKKIGLLVLSLATVLCLAACNNNGEFKDENIGKSGEQNIVNNNQENKELETNDKYASISQNPIVTMEMENGNIIKMELYPKVAPTTVENFISLIEQGFYNGLTFHRVIPTFMAQGGDPNGNGTGGPGYNIKGEFVENGFKNEIHHEIGVVSMARTNDPNGAGSQFFIVTNEESYQYLDDKYAGFGKVTEGMEFVYDIVNSEVIRREVDEDVLLQAYQISYELNMSGGEPNAEQQVVFDKYYAQTAEIDRPINPPTIKTMTVETFGVDYDEPVKITE